MLLRKKKSKFIIFVSKKYGVKNLSHDYEINKLNGLVGYLTEFKNV